MVLTTHFMDEAEQLADDVVIVDAGRVIAARHPRRAVPGRRRGHPALLRPARPRPRLAAHGAARGQRRGASSTPGSYRIEGKVDPQLLATVTSWCAQHGVLPDRIAVERRTLEDVFLELTGKELRA